jgi:hypothetical protein
MFWHEPREASELVVFVAVFAVAMCASEQCFGEFHGWLILMAAILGLNGIIALWRRRRAWIRVSRALSVAQMHKHGQVRDLFLIAKPKHSCSSPQTGKAACYSTCPATR